MLKNPLVMLQAPGWLPLFCRRGGQTSSEQEPGFCFKLKPGLRFEMSRLKYLPSPISLLSEIPEIQRSPMKSPDKLYRS